MDWLACKQQKFLTLLEAGKVRIMALADLVFGKGFLVAQMVENPPAM